jgi:hypothetical protein
MQELEPVEDNRFRGSVEHDHIALKAITILSMFVQSTITVLLCPWRIVPRAP